LIINKKFASFYSPSESSEKFPVILTGLTEGFAESFKTLS
jgi:hypothetical protein